MQGPVLLVQAGSEATVRAPMSWPPPSFPGMGGAEAGSRISILYPSLASQGETGDPIIVLKCPVLYCGPPAPPPLSLFSASVWLFSLPSQSSVVLSFISSFHLVPQSPPPLRVSVSPALHLFGVSLPFPPQTLPGLLS